MKLRAKFETRASTTATPAPTPAPAPPPPIPDDDPQLTPAARNLARAHDLQRMIERGLISDYTQAARMLAVSQPRITHLMGLLLLSPAIQQDRAERQGAAADGEDGGLGRAAALPRELTPRGLARDGRAIARQTC